MKATLLLAAGAALFATAACTNDGMGPRSAGEMPAAANAPMPTDAAGYVANAGASDLYEMQSSQIALQKSQNASVRQFAQMMITDHTQTTQTVMAAAQAAGMTPPPPMLMPMQADMIAQLQSANGADFDRMYLSQQVQAHQMALALHSNYMKHGDTPQLRQAASSAVPIVRMHLDRVKSLARM